MLYFWTVYRVQKTLTCTYALSINTFIFEIDSNLWLFLSLTLFYLWLFWPLTWSLIWSLTWPPTLLLRAITSDLWLQLHIYNLWPNFLTWLLTTAAYLQPLTFDLEHWTLDYWPNFWQISDLTPDPTSDPTSDQHLTQILTQLLIQPLTLLLTNIWSNFWPNVWPNYWTDFWSNFWPEFWLNF